MENNLDKYFKDKLHDRKFEMKEAYWLGAEKLLDAQDKRRKRRVLFWWFSGGLGALLLVGFGFWFLGKNGEEKPVQTSANIASQTAKAGDTAPQNQTEKSGDETRQTADGKPAGNQFSEADKTQNVNQDIKTTEKQPTENQSIANNKTRSLSSKTAPANSRSNPVAGLKNNAQTDGKKSGNLVENDEEISGKTAPETPAKPVSQAVDSRLKSGEEAPLERAISPDFLALLPYFVTGDFDENDLATTVKKIDVSDPRRLHFGFLASQLVLPNPGKDEKTFIGQRAGLVLRYDFRNKLYLSSGVQYLHRTGSFDATKSATQRNYRFGLELDSLELRPTSLHYLSLPVLLGFQQNRHQLEAGLLIDFLTGVRGETGSHQKQGEPPVKVFKAEKSGWVTTDGYRRIVPTLQLNYRYNLVGRWSLSLSANYMIGGILDNNYDAPVGSFLLKETEKFQLGAQVVYLFN